MDDREKVIKGLECCWSADDKCYECPYMTGVKQIGTLNGEMEYVCECDKLSLCKDALALLKAQEPRVMTLEEVRDLAGNYEIVWAEDNSSDDCCEGYCSPDLHYRTQEIILWVPGNECEYAPNNDTYGKKWRCWTSRPTNEQREAMAWKS